MPTGRFDRFVSANRELRSFLERVDELVHGTCNIDAEELRGVSCLLESMAPEIGETSPAVPVDSGLHTQVQEYIGNLRTLQLSLEQVRCVMFARLAQIDAARQHMNGLQSWTTAYRQTA